MKQLIQIVLAIILVLCVLKMPYGYYQFVRLVTCIGMCYLAYEERKQPALMLGCIGIAILLNPVFKVHFDKHTWNIIDVAIAIALVVWVAIDLAVINRKRNKT